MKLGELERLLARLALKMQSPQLNQLRFSCSELTEAQKMEAQSPIKLLTILKRKSKSNDQFVSTLEQHFEGIQDFEDLTAIVQEFRSENPDPNSIKPLAGPILPNGAFAFRPERNQSHHFKRMLLNVSNSLNWIHLEIMVAISPIPDSLKEHMNKGYQLFEELKRHGCISENDTEFLNDVFTLLNLQTPLQFLQSYQHQYPQTIFPEPPPSAPTFATPPSSLQPSYSSPSEGSPSFLSLPTHYSPVETGGLSPHQPFSLPHQVSTYPHTTPHTQWQHNTYPRPPQITSSPSQTQPQHETYPRPPQTTSSPSRTQWQHETYPRPPQTTSRQPQTECQRNTHPRPVATSGTSSSLHSNQQPVQATIGRCSSPEIPYPTRRSLEERRKKRPLGEGDLDPSEEHPPVKRRIQELSTPSISSRASTSSLGSSLSSLSSYHAHHEFESAITVSGGSGQESIAEGRQSDHHETGYQPTSALSQTVSAASHHSTHSGSYLTDKERRVYGVHRPEGRSMEESRVGGTVPPDGSLPLPNVTEESGAEGTRIMVGSQGSLLLMNVTPPRHVLTRTEAGATPSLNESVGAEGTRIMVGSQGSLPLMNVTPPRHVLTHSEAGATPSLNESVEQQESTAGENDELVLHRTSTGNPVRQASSQSNVAIETYKNFHHPQLQAGYILQLPTGYQTFDQARRKQFVPSVQPPSFGSSSGCSLVTGTSYYPSGTSLATSDLLSSESSGPESSYQGSTMPSQPSFEPSLPSVEEEQSEEEREEEEESWVKRPKPAKSASSTKQRKSSTPAEERKKQTKSWASSLLGLPTKVVSGVWSTLSGGTEEKKEEDSDSSFKSCKDDEGSSSD